MPLGTVLVVEDDEPIRTGIVDAIRFAGYEAIAAADGAEGLDVALGAEVDLVLLDVLLPKLDGFEVLTRLRASRPVLPVIMLTARGAETDRVRGLRGGADDYVVKPFSAAELLARVEAVLRRSAERPVGASSIAVSGCEIDFERREIAMPDGGRVRLSERETELLRYLASNRGRAISRAELLARLWGIDPRGVQTRAVDMHVARIREALGAKLDRDAVIVTVRGRGYMLADGAA